ncbi:MAG: hypothetical protein V8R51_00640 [Clostridia bacterium]
MKSKKILIIVIILIVILGLGGATFAYLFMATDIIFLKVIKNCLQNTCHKI